MAELKTYSDVQNFLNTLLNQQQLDDTVNGSPHGAWWQTMTEEEFINGEVPNMGVPILVKGNGLESYIVMALLGTGPFAPGGDYPRMPADGVPPFYGPAEVEPLINWINRIIIKLEQPGKAC